VCIRVSAGVCRCERRCVYSQPYNIAKYVCHVSFVCVCHDSFVGLSAGVYMINDRVLLQYMCHASAVCVYHDSCVCVCASVHRCERRCVYGHL